MVEKFGYTCQGEYEARVVITPSKSDNFSIPFVEDGVVTRTNKGDLSSVVRETEVRFPVHWDRDDKRIKISSRLKDLAEEEDGFLKAKIQYEDPSGEWYTEHYGIITRIGSGGKDGERRLFVEDLTNLLKSIRPKGEKTFDAPYNLKDIYEYVLTRVKEELSSWEEDWGYSGIEYNVIEEESFLTLVEEFTNDFVETPFDNDKTFDMRHSMAEILTYATEKTGTKWYVEYFDDKAPSINIVNYPETKRQSFVDQQIYQRKKEEIPIEVIDNTSLDKIPEINTCVAIGNTTQVKVRHTPSYKAHGEKEFYTTVEADTDNEDQLREIAKNKLQEEIRDSTGGEITINGRADIKPNAVVRVLDRCISETDRDYQVYGSINGGEAQGIEIIKKGKPVEEFYGLDSGEANHEYEVSKTVSVLIYENLNTGKKSLVMTHHDGEGDSNNTYSIKTILSENIDPSEDISVKDDGEASADVYNTGYIGHGFDGAKTDGVAIDAKALSDITLDFDQGYDHSKYGTGDTDLEKVRLWISEDEYEEVDLTGNTDVRIKFGDLSEITTDYTYETGDFYSRIKTDKIIEADPVNNNLFSTDGSTINIYDTEDKSSPQQISTLTTSVEPIYHLEYDDNLLIVSGYNGREIYKVNEDGSIVLEDRIQTKKYAASKINGYYIYSLIIDGASSKVEIVDKEYYNVESTITDISGDAVDIDVLDEKLSVLTQDFISNYNISDPTSPSFIESKQIQYMDTVHSFYLPETDKYLINGKDSNDNNLVHYVRNLQDWGGIGDDKTYNEYENAHGIQATGKKNGFVITKDNQNRNWLSIEPKVPGENHHDQREISQIDELNINDNETNRFSSVIRGKYLYHYDEVEELTKIIKVESFLGDELDRSPISEISFNKRLKAFDYNEDILVAGLYEYGTNSKFIQVYDLKDKENPELLKEHSFGLYQESYYPFDITENYNYWGVGSGDKAYLLEFDKDTGEITRQEEISVGYSVNKNEPYNDVRSISGRVTGANFETNDYILTSIDYKNSVTNSLTIFNNIDFDEVKADFTYHQSSDMLVAVSSEDDSNDNQKELKISLVDITNAFYQDGGLTELENITLDSGGLETNVWAPSVRFLDEYKVAINIEARNINDTENRASEGKTIIYDVSDGSISKITEYNYDRRVFSVKTKPSEPHITVADKAYDIGPYVKEDQNSLIRANNIDTDDLHYYGNNLNTYSNGVLFLGDGTDDIIKIYDVRDRSSYSPSEETQDTTDDNIWQPVERISYYSANYPDLVNTAYDTYERNNGYNNNNNYGAGISGESFYLGTTSDTYISDSIIEVEDSPSLDRLFNSDGTISFWFKPDNELSTIGSYLYNYSSIVGKHYRGDDGWSVAVNKNGDLIIVMFQNGYEKKKVVSTDISVGNWYFVALSQNDDDITVYFSEKGGTLNSETFSTEGHIDFTTDARMLFEGPWDANIYIDEVRLYANELSYKQIKKIRNNPYESYKLPDEESNLPVAPVKYQINDIIQRVPAGADPYVTQFNLSAVADSLNIFRVE